MSQTKSSRNQQQRAEKSRWNWVSSKNINKNEVDISHFRILDIVGAGGFCKVFLAQNRITKEKVAIKVIDKLRAVKSSTFRKTLWVERDVMSGNESSFLLNVKHVFQGEREIYFVLPYMEGSDLTHYARSHHYLNENELKLYIAQLVLAMEELHSRDIVHRDIKPRNMLLDAEGNMKLCDYGLAVQLNGGQDMATGIAGTEAYCAPEMVMGEKYGKSVDVWSFGVTMFELLGKRRPFKSDAHMKDRYRQQHFDPIDFSKAHKMSSQARDLISQCLTWDVSKRLGCGPKGVSELKSHPFFDGIDFGAVEKLELVPAYCPKDDTTPTKKVDDHVLQEKDVPARALAEWEQEYFKNIEFNTSIKKRATKSSNSKTSSHDETLYRLRERMSALKTSA